MPIDITLLRPTEDGGNINEVERWQLCRLKNRSKESEDEIQSLLTEIADLEQDRRRLLKESCQSRARLKHLQSLLAPKKKKRLNGKPTSISSCASGEEKAATVNNLDDENDADIKIIREEIAMLKKEKIPLLTDQVAQITLKLETHSPKLMNIVVDGKSFPELYRGDIDRNRVESVEQVSETLFIDPMYCLGAYEKIMIPTFQHTSKDGGVATVDEEKALLSRFGPIISDALCMYAKKFIQHFDGVEQGQLHYLDVPATVQLQSTSMFHAVMGCHKGIAPGCKDTSINDATYVVPSNIVNAMVHQNKTFTDRELPKMYISSTSVILEEAKVGYKKLSLAHSTKRIETFTLCTSNIRLSTEVQDDIVENIIAFYQSLLTTPTDTMKVTSKISRLEAKCSREAPLLRARSVISSELEPNEARRITIEGFLASSKSYIYLGHVSNYTDYISRALKIKCGGGCGQPNEYAHLIHGTILCCHGALQWVLENNLVSVDVEEDTPLSDKKARAVNTQVHQNGILIPPSLVKYMNVDGMKGLNSILFLPFIRELVKRKGGKISTNELVKGTKSDPIWLHPHNDSTNQNEDERSHSRDDIKKEAGGQNIVLQLPSLKDEAVCNPYDFLPLYLN